jgi:hypothetical protein
MNHSTRYLFLMLLVALGAVGCGGDDSMAVAPGPCAGLKTTDLADDPDVAAALGAHVPVSLNAYCADKVSFGWDGGVVDIVYIAYGAAATVPATPNTVCALDSGSGVSFLFDAVWANNEPPLSITAECPAIALDATGDTAVQCTAPPVSGRTHPVLTDRNFRRFFTDNPLPRQIAVCGRLLPPGVP